MDTTQEPVDTIAECHLIDAWAKEWQDWYRKHQVVAQMDKAPETKGLHKDMHNTTSTADIFEDPSVKAMWMEKAKNYFADTLAEFQYELSGKDFYKAFYQAAHENMKHAQKEYERTKELVDMLRYHHLGQS